MSFEQIEEHSRRRTAEARARSRLAARAFLLEQMRVEYCTTGNPLAVSKAWQLSRRSGLPVPDWVTSHLDSVFETIGEFVEKPPAGNLAEAVGVALGFGFTRKHENPLTDWRERLEGERWFAAFEAHLQRGLSPTSARQEVAREFNSTEATVRRRLGRFAEGLGTTPEAMAEARLRHRAEIERQLDDDEARTTARLERAFQGLPDADALSDTPPG